MIIDKKIQNVELEHTTFYEYIRTIKMLGLPNDASIMI